MFSVKLFAERIAGFEPARQVEYHLLRLGDPRWLATGLHQPVPIKCPVSTPLLPICTLMGRGSIRASEQCRIDFFPGREPSTVLKKRPRWLDTSQRGFMLKYPRWQVLLPFLPLSVAVAQGRYFFK